MAEPTYSTVIFTIAVRTRILIEDHNVGIRYPDTFYPLETFYRIEGEYFVFIMCDSPRVVSQTETSITLRATRPAREIIDLTEDTDEEEDEEATVMLPDDDFDWWQPLIEFD